MTHLTPQQHDAYRQGRCVLLCGRRQSAGRPRCHQCHEQDTREQNRGEAA